MRLTLITLPVLQAPTKLSYYGAVPPLGPAYVAAALRRAGHDLQVIDGAGLALDRQQRWVAPGGDLLLRGLPVDAIVERIRSDAQVVGVSNMFLHEVPLLRNLARLVKQRLPDVFLVAGGENATGFWSSLLAMCPELDACILGEGEAAFVDLLSTLASGAPLAEAGSLAYREGGVATSTARARRITAIDELPRPAWDLFETERYLLEGCGSGVHRGRSMPLLTSRGCPFRCTFCSCENMWGTRYLARDPDAVVDEIEVYVHRYGISNVSLRDPAPLMTRRWIDAFCAALERRELRVTWQLPSGGRGEIINGATAERMYEAGCRNYCFSPESGSTRLLARLQKELDPGSLLGPLGTAVAARIKTHASFIIGLPEERAGDLWRSFGLILRMAVAGLHGVSVIAFTPYPGSAAYRRLEAKGAIEVDEAFLTSSLRRSLAAGRSWHPVWRSWQIYLLQLLMMANFYALQFLLRPWRFVLLATRLLGRSQETVLEQFLHEKWRQLARLRRASP